MKPDLQRMELMLSVSAKRLSAASIDATVDASPGSAFPRWPMQVGAISVDTSGREVSGQKGTCVQWR